MEQKLKCYYAHCVQIYDTPQEKRDIKLLTILGFDVVNPNEPHHQEGYRRRGMDYFLLEVIPGCDCCAFRALPNLSIPAGVAKEIDAFRCRPVFEIPSMSLRRVLSVEETRAYLREMGQR